MTKTVQPVGGAIGYREQLDRTRRFLRLVETTTEDFFEATDCIDFQDMMWSFFQHCWHVKDWIRYDPKVLPLQRCAVINAAEQSKVLTICQDLCNGSKHLRLNTPHSGAGAKYQHFEMTVVPEQGRFEMDCMLDDGYGNLISGILLANECVSEWERILASQGLASR